MSFMHKMCFSLRYLRHKSLIRQTISSSVVLKRFKHNNNENKDIESIFLLPKVQTLLERLIGFDDNIVFKVKPTLTANANEIRFMTDNELNLMRALSRQRAKEKIDMPPVLNPKEDNPKILSKDFELQGYIDSKFVFVDSSGGSSDQTRLIVVRETNGILREANREERYRMNQMFFPKEERLIETPKMFSEPHLQAVFYRHEYEFALDRACLQFEPNDPQYIDICHKTYEHILANYTFDTLKSTRHFGPMCFYYAFNRKIDNLLNHFILNEAINEGSDLIKLYYICHSNDSQLLSDIESENTNPLELVKKYISEESENKSILELSLQKYEEIQREMLSLNEDIDKQHGIQN